MKGAIKNHRRQYNCFQWSKVLGVAAWASEFMQMQNIESLLFITEQNDNLEHIKSALNKNFIKLIDTMKLHGISSQKNNVLNIPLNEIESC